MRSTANLKIKRNEQWTCLYIFDLKANTATSYNLVKGIKNSHYIYIKSHTFSNPIDGMFGNLIEVTQNVQDLNNGILYIHRYRRRKTK